MPLTPRTEVLGQCPHCNHIASSPVSEKNTIVCLECNGPFELYSDGRTEVSALFEAVGTVSYVPDKRGVSYYQYPTMRTRYRAY